MMSDQMATRAETIVASTSIAMTHLSLFSGIGGIDLAAHWAGFRTVAFVERDPFCQKVLAKNFPGVPIHDDVTTFDPSPYVGTTLVSGGFPCQDVSSAHDNMGIEGARSSLFRELVRTARIVRPRFLLMENVPGLIARGLGVVLGELAEIGMDAEWCLTSAATAGAPHLRERLWIVAYAHSERFQAPQVFRERIKQSVIGWGERHHSRGRISGRSWITPPPECFGVDDGLSSGLDSDRIRALGNSVVPQQVFPVLEAIAKSVALEVA